MEALARPFWPNPLWPFSMPCNITALTGPHCCTSEIPTFRLLNGYMCIRVNTSGLMTCVEDKEEICRYWQTTITMNTKSVLR